MLQEIRKIHKILKIFCVQKLQKNLYPQNAKQTTKKMINISQSAHRPFFLLIYPNVCRFFFPFVAKWYPRKWPLFAMVNLSKQLYKVWSKRLLYICSVQITKKTLWQPTCTLSTKFSGKIQPQAKTHLADEFLRRWHLSPQFSIAFTFVDAFLQVHQFKPTSPKTKHTNPENKGSALAHRKFNCFYTLVLVPCIKSTRCLEKLLHINKLSAAVKKL